MDRKQQIALIQHNIEKHGCHVYAIAGAAAPRWIYTIGGTQTLGYELIFAGGAIYDQRAVARLLTGLLKDLEAVDDPLAHRVSHEEMGDLALAPVHADWGREMCLGALDYYQTDTVCAFQVYPTDEDHLTIDIPNLSVQFDPSEQIVWRWFRAAWPFEIDASSTLNCDRDLMLGYQATEIIRWEQAHWQSFSGEPPDHPDDVFTVPFATLLAFDNELARAASLPLGKGLIREIEEDGSMGPLQDW